MYVQSASGDLSGVNIALDMSGPLISALNTDAKVKPYDCRFCVRSYGRKDLVVRHEKTLHEAEWNSAQSFIKKETNYSNGFSSSRGKRQFSSSSTSRSDELKSSTSPSRVTHPNGVNHSSPHFAVQTTALPTSNKKLYVAPVHYNYSHALTPGSQEIVDYPHDSLIPDQYYVEEQYVHQFNHPKSEQSAETYEEPDIMPVDPNLLESPITKTRLRSPQTTPGYLGVLSMWPDIYSSENHLECHRMYENGLKGASIPGYAQGRLIDGELSFLRSTSNRAKPPTLNMIIDEGILKSLCFNTTYNLKQCGIDNTPNARLLPRYLDQFFHCFNHSIPMFHLPTIEIHTIPAPLILAMCSIGASQVSNREASRELIGRAYEHLECSGAEKHPSVWASPRPIWKLQCHVLLIFAGCFLGDVNTAVMAVERVGIFHREFSPLKTWLESNREQSGRGSWKTWIEYETSTRLFYSMFIMSSLLTTVYDVAPCMSTAQIVGLELPSADALWEAPDAGEWLDLQRANMSQLPRWKFEDLLTPLISGQGARGIGEVKEASALSNFGITAVTHALNMYVWNLKQCTTFSPQNFTGNDNNAEVEVDAFAIKQAENSISGCSQLLAYRFPKVTGDSKRSVLDEVAIFNGFALLRSSFLRSFTTEASISIHAALLSTDDVTIQLACNRYAKEPWHRGQFRENAAIKLFTDLLAPLYILRTGARQPELGMGLLEWNVEHSISVFDSVLFFTKWLFDIETLWQRSPNVQRWRDIMNNVNELIGKREDVRTALVARATGAFASLMADDDSTLGGTETQALILQAAPSH
ncbi:hypothetical protein ACJ72_07378 [Emergomyces africanus]|uniref:C2H2-type domain-containing protein n=1 Tax=Emergomyces africanus TaxID=1955775 RepID=A0A1B7NNV6_9EURO|nr:hypothetical protein ACJ72_07378 [Emergomyces africanus]